jgi:hypothetical protein
MNEEQHTNELKLILPVHLLREHSTVRKATGSKAYTVVDTIKIFGEQHIHTEIKAEEGVRFLVSQNGGGISAISSDKSVAVWGSIKELSWLLNELRKD